MVLSQFQSQAASVRWSVLSAAALKFDPVVQATSADGHHLSLIKRSVAARTHAHIYNEIILCITYTNIIYITPTPTPTHTHTHPPTPTHIYVCVGVGGCGGGCDVYNITICYCHQQSELLGLKPELGW